MEEMLGDNSRGPSKGIFQLYEQWADGGWGMILTGAFHALYHFCTQRIGLRRKCHGIAYTSRLPI